MYETAAGVHHRVFYGFEYLIMLSEGPSDIFAQQNNCMFFLDISKSFNGSTVAMILGAVRFQLTHFLVMIVRICIFLLASSDGKNKPLGTVKG